MSSALSTLRVGAVLVALAGTSSMAHAKLDYAVSFLDAQSELSGFYDQIVGHVGAALSDWGRHVAGNAKIDVEVQVTDTIPAAAASSRASAYVGERGGYRIYESGMSFKINMGMDVNGDTPDIEILLNPGYVRDELWFDPQPWLRKALVPLDKTDAMSVFIHEVGHALAFNGWGSHTDGTLPADYASTWDINTMFDGTNLFFTGQLAEQAYGSIVPVTAGNNYHIGNANGLGEDLLSDVMNGAVFMRGQRYDISPLDLAMVEDMGVVVQPVPEVRSSWMMAFGLLALSLQTGWLKRRLAGHLGRPGRLIRLVAPRGYQ